MGGYVGTESPRYCGLNSLVASRLCLIAVTYHRDLGRMICGVSADR